MISTRLARMGALVSCCSHSHLAASTVKAQTAAKHELHPKHKQSLLAFFFVDRNGS